MSWSSDELPNVQKQKLHHLLERGAEVKSVCFLLKVKSPDCFCTLDDFGHVNWMASLDPADKLASKLGATQV
jgi:hypothetical protein